ncbi:uncharacterized protein C8A04DRAFT_9365 [Dichotomopilus funicola]|uniref:Uncharacterized protein n=1 Tax=Dichotomopilus funicola TaxID=1934379 RepID=A0AAN6ZPL9_9PEZI|nr:hypothetical protein C8A04DRAFT_9365 [Dichotomopilus funicola]
MDAQNAAEPASTKPPAASPKRPGTDADHPRPPAVTKLSSASKLDLSLKDGRLGASSARLGDEDAVGDGNSDAETIVLPGKDGHSPSKVRKIIKHENSDTEDGPSTSSSLLSRKHSHLKQDRDGDKGDRGARADRPEKPEKSVSTTGIGHTESTVSILGRKKKQLDKSKAKDGSSGLSSAPGSPPPTQRRRRPSNTHSKSDSETAPAEFTKSSIKDRGRPLDKVVPHKRKAPRPDSDDEAENRKIRRQRTSGSGLDASRKHHLPPSKPQTEHASPAVPASRNRSISPHSRVHRRSISTTQLPGQSSNGLSHKKKRIPAPLQSTDYLSDESSASGSPHPRSSKLRGLATPATADSNASPAKMAPHKKHLDAHGQTFLARACAKGEYDVAKHRLQERPEDINVADYAGNTPLQIAALNGYDDIVKLLVDAGCYLDCVNNDKDTPLLDAVENGHLDVVKILLNAGVNPRKANAYGQEPIDRVNDELDYADEIRRALREAKAKMGERRRTSEEHQPDQTDTRSSYGPDSPRRSPGVMGSAHTIASRRSGTVRATKTSNHLLYMPMDDKTLRAAAARGDEETVTRILQVRENFDDPESMVAAARGGHDLVMQLLLALGRANPDPSPISSQSSEYSTPMLAAIGQENLKVVRLLLDQVDQGNFDPTRRIKGEAYHEIAKRRRGPNWMEEEHMLKDAYDEYRKSHKSGSSKNRSPNRREQEREREPRRKLDIKDEAAKLHKRKAVSPTREPKRLTATKLSASPKEKRRATSLTAQPDDQTSPKRGPGRPKKDDRIPTIAVSDREPSPAGRPAAKIRRAESDLAAVSSEGETTKPRRKLVSGRELKGERERQRRPSLTSNASSMKEPSSPREEPEKAPMSEKYHDRTKALKRDESRDRLPVSGDSTGKRHRSSATPPHLGLSDKDSGDGPVKRRRLDAENKDGKEKRPKSSQSDDKHLKTPVPRDSGLSSAAASRAPSKTRDEEERKPKPKKTEALLQQGRREAGKSASSEGSIHVKSEDQDVDMPDAPPAATNISEPKPVPSQKDDEVEKKKNQAEVEERAREAKRKENEMRRKEEEDKIKEKEQEMEKERLRREEESKKLAETEARKREEEEKRRKEEEERKRKEEDERRKREEEERKAREEEQKRRLQEEQRKKREEAERKKKEEEERRKKEEQERKKREEEECLRREQLEREAAEEARRQREEEEKREQERKERAHREEMERRRAAREAERAAKEAEQRRIRLEQERARLDKLPPVLRWLDQAANPKAAEVAEKFSTTQGVRYDCMNPGMNGTAAGREQWLLNTQVALLLGEKDLSLSRYTAWPKVPASPAAKRAIWRLESDRYALTTPALYEIGEQLEGYYQGLAPKTMSYVIFERLRAEAWAKFEAMDLFFVKASDFLFIIPTVQHLRHVKITMTYCEISETWPPQQKWRDDPDAKSHGGFAPSNKHYINGQKVSEDKPCLREASTSPFPRQRIPRRSLPSISGDGLSHMTLSKERSMDIDTEPTTLPNGVHSSPISRASHGGNGEINGRQPLSLTTTVATNGTENHPLSPSSEAGPAQARPLINGTHDISGTTAHTE